jgi:hypothetical protein
MNLIDRINNKNLKNIAETLSDNHYNPDWKNNDSSGDWYLGIHDEWLGSDYGTKRCEAIIIPDHNGFSDEVMSCFLDECDKGKDIDYENNNYGRKVIFVKPKYNNLSEDYLKFLYGEE